MIGSYNDNHLSPNAKPSSNQGWYGPVYLVYKRLVNLRKGQRYNKEASGTLLSRVIFDD